MQLTVNGKQIELELQTVQELVQHYGLKEAHVVAEVNGEIIDRAIWEDHQLEPGAKIELVHFVGGG
nr:sulfur carrier protein ThiS [Caldalkalibacillus salinus]